jgi:hypothetical protein
VSAQQSTNAVLAQIHQTLQAQNALLANALPGSSKATSGLKGLLAGLRGALGESVYVVAGNH